MIQVEGLWYSKGHRDILRDVNLSLKRGEVLALLGPNGAGKTTLAKHLNGLLKPARGRVLVDGIDTRYATVSELSKKVAYVFQEPEKMFFTGRVFDEVAFGPANMGFEEKEVERMTKWALSLVGLGKYENLKPLSLSGGERRRLAIACALAMGTDYIVLDEPTSNLDGRGFEAVLGIIKKLKGNNKGILLITHDIELALEVADRVAVLFGGRVVFRGQPWELLHLGVKRYGLRETLGLRIIRGHPIERT